MLPIKNLFISVLQHLKTDVPKSILKDKRLNQVLLKAYQLIGIDILVMLCQSSDIFTGWILENP